MKPKMVIAGLCLIAVVACAALWGTIPLPDLIKQPIRSLLGSAEQIHMGVLEVSENINPVEEATRRLFKPFGVVRLLRRYPASPSSSDSPATTTVTTTSSSDPQP